MRLSNNLWLIEILILHVFQCSDADETKNWINEKDKVLSSDDYGKDLASVNALLRKHEALERDLAAVEDKVIKTSVFFFVWDRPNLPACNENL